MSITALPPTVPPEELEAWPVVEPTYTTPPTPSHYIPRVAREAERLDRLFPGWESRVNIGTLDITDGQNCILGQCAYRKSWFRHTRLGYRRGIRIVEADTETTADYFAEAYFSNHTRNAWISEINKRRHT